MSKDGGRVGPTERLPEKEVKRLFPMQATARDGEVCDLVARFGGATTGQLKKGHFPGNWTTCTRRTQKLFQNSFLWRNIIDLHLLGLGEGQEILHTLDIEGAKLVAQQWGVPVETIWKPSDKTISQQTLKHLLPVVDILLSFKLAAAAKGYTIKDLETDHTWRKKPTNERLQVDYLATYGDQDVFTTGEIIPDASFTLVTPEREYLFVVEYDTGTEVRKLSMKPRAGVRDSSVINKVKRYIALLHKEKRTQPSVYEKITGKDQRGIRVLFVTKSDEKGLFELIQEAGGKNSYWVAPFSLVTREDFVLEAPIWTKCGDDVPMATPLLGGKSALALIQDRLCEYGVGPEEIERVKRELKDLAASELARSKKPEGGIDLGYAVALRADEWAEATLAQIAVDFEENQVHTFLREEQ